MHLDILLHRVPHAQSLTPTCRPFRLVGIFLILCAWVPATAVRAQDHTLLFDAGSAGVSKGMTNWGLDTCWPSYDNLRRGLVFMGTENVNMVRVGFVADAPLVGGTDLSASQKATLQTCADLAGMATAATRWDMNLLFPVDSWYQSGANTVYADRWANAIIAAQRYYNRPIYSVEGFNEPDYAPWGQGSQQNLYDIFGLLQASTNFPGTHMAGGSTLSTGPAVSWFNAVASRASIGTTHCLAGSAADYVNFIQTVAASNASPHNPELHNVMEAMMGVEYGLEGGTWWGTAERARGEFVKACQGQRLGYADDWGKWTAASVYRAPSGKVEAFVGESERQALPTTYRFFSKDRDVFYDGHGPQRAYTVTTTGGPGYQTTAHKNAERVVDVTYGADVPPPINGRYIVVARHSSKVMEVESGSANNGANIRQNPYTGLTYQQWDITPLPSTNGGDYSYYSMKAVHSGKSADVFNFALDDGGDVRQWESLNGVNQHWFLEYVGNGWFNIRSRWSGKYLDVEGGSTANGANIFLWSGNGQLNQQWRLIPVGNNVEFVPPGLVTGVHATANPRSVQLTWDKNLAFDLAGYTVLRSTNSGGPYEIVARGLTNNAFTDKSANLPIPYYYIVKAVDKSLNSSVNSAQVSATPTGEAGLIARYTFDGNADDSSVNANDTIIVAGSPDFMAPGQYGTAMDLNGTSQYTMLPANLLAGVTNFTIALWVRWDGGGAWQRVFDFGNDSAENMFLTPNSGDGTLRFAITTNSGDSEQRLDAPALPVGQWRHVAVTRDGNAAKLFVNGVVEDTDAVTISPASFNPALNYLGDSQYEIDPLFNGRLDELFIYDYALSDTEIMRLMSNHPPPPAEPTTLSTTIAGNTMHFVWPSNYFGCRLESNAVSLTATGAWFTVSGTANTNQISIPADTSASNVFFRLVYP